MTIKINGTNTTAQPSITGTDTDTGLVYGTDEVKIVTGGTDRVTVNNTGLGIGTSSPTAKIEVHDGSGTSAQVVKINSGGVGLLSIQSGTNTDSRIEFGDSANDDAGYIYYENDNEVMRFGVNASEQMRIDSSGNVVIGTTSSTSKLRVIGNEIRFSNSSNASYYGTITHDAGSTGANIYNNVDATAASHIWQHNGTEVMRIDSSGRVGINSTAPGSQLELNAAAATVMGISLGTTSDTITASRYIGICNNADQTNLGANSGFQGIEFGGPSSVNEGYLALHTHDNGVASGERMRIDKSGNLGVGTTSPGGKIEASFNSGSVIGLVLRNAAQGTSARFYSGASIVGSITVTSSATAYNTSSDYRLKENVVDIADGITRVKQLQPKRFNFIVDPGTTVDGFLAHEAQTVVPEAITGTKDEVDDDGNAVMQGIDQSKLVPLLTAALQEAITKIETLETQNASLEARLTALEGGAS